MWLSIRQFLIFMVSKDLVTLFIIIHSVTMKIQISFFFLYLLCICIHLLKNRWKYNGETVLKSRLFIFYARMFCGGGFFCSPITFCLTIIYKRVKFAHCVTPIDIKCTRSHPSFFFVLLFTHFWLILNKMLDVNLVVYEWVKLWILDDRNLIWLRTNDTMEKPSSYPFCWSEKGMNCI